MGIVQGAPSPGTGLPGDEPLDVEDLRSRVQKAINDHLSLQEQRLEEVGPDMAVLLDGVRGLLTGGKRLRAAFCYWAWRGAGGPDCPQIVVAATGLEFFQAAALLHDDVMDGSDTRRGHPSMHRRLARLHGDHDWSGDAQRFGEAGAILAGDLCLSWSDELLSASELPADGVAAARATFDTMRTQLMGGQFLDVLEQAMAEQQGGADVGRALQVLRYKSAKYTVEHPLLVGAALAGADSALRQSYSAYGLPLGEAFQLRDDVLGVFGDPALTGKPAGDDLREGKQTVLIAQARTLGSAVEWATVHRHLGDPELQESGLGAAREAIVSSGALIAVEAMIDERAESARAALCSSAVREPARTVLGLLIDSATDRQG